MITFSAVEAYNSVSTDGEDRGAKEKDKEKLYPERKIRMNYKRTPCVRHGAVRRQLCVRRDHPCAEARTPCEREDVRENCAQCVSYDEREGYPSLATVYHAHQCWQEINDGCEGLTRGTIFKQLDKPFMGDKCRSGGRCK